MDLDEYDDYCLDKARKFNSDFGDKFNQAEAEINLLKQALLNANTQVPKLGVLVDKIMEKINPTLPDKKTRSSMS